MPSFFEIFSIYCYFLWISSTVSRADTNVGIHTRCREFLQRCVISEAENTTNKAKITIDVKILTVWSEVFPVLCTNSGSYQARDGIISDFYVREVFPIFHQDIVFWLISLDKIGFENQCFQISFCLYIVDMLDYFYHLLFGEIQFCFWNEIRSNSRLQIIRFPDVDDFAIFVSHEIDSWARREVLIECFFVCHEKIVVSFRISQNQKTLSILRGLKICFSELFSEETNDSCVKVCFWLST